MAKNKQEKAAASRKAANIIVGIVSGVAALLIIAIIVLVSVRVDPMDKLDRPVRYDFYDLGSSEVSFTNDAAQTEIHTAMGEMDFNVMSAILRWKWDYSYNFVRNTKDEKIEMTADEIEEIGATGSAYMIEYVYDRAKIVDGEVDKSSCRSLEVDGETVYFDRLKVVIGNTDGNVGEIYLYPYIYERVINHAADGGATRATYRITAIKVRANTSGTYIARGDLAKKLK